MHSSCRGTILLGALAAFAMLAKAQDPGLTRGDFLIKQAFNTIPQLAYDDRSDPPRQSRKPHGASRNEEESVRNNGKESVSEPNPKDPAAEACRVVADERLAGPLKAIAAEFQRRGGSRIALSFQPPGKVNALAEKNGSSFDAVFCMAMTREGKTSLDSLPDAKKVAWKLLSGEPVWAAAIGQHSEAKRFVSFVGGPTGHRFWSESTAGFTITSGKTHAEAFA